MKLSFKKSFMFVLTILALTFSAVRVTPAYAATLTVTNTTDSGTGSLRAIIATAGVGDTITFDASLSGGTIYLGYTLIIAQDVTIDGSALASQITISGDTDNNGTGNVRVFNVNTGVTATLNSLIITKGTGSDGGGIYNRGTLTVTNSTLSGNSASGYGGGIFNRGRLTVTNSTLSGNSATGYYGGGGIANWGTLAITNSTLSGNSAAGSGGGIMTVGMLTVTNSTLSGNTAAYGGGGIFNNSGNTVAVTNSMLSSNSARWGGGIENYGTVTVTNSTLFGNSADYGGGISNEDTLTVTNSIFSVNSATNNGGGISNYFGTLTVTNNTLSGNSATNNGGGISNYFGTLTVTNSTLSENSAGNSGGSIYNDNDFGGTLTVTNSTLSGNSADYGGGIYNLVGTLNYANTIIANSSSGGDCANYDTIGTNTNNLVEDASCSASLSSDPKLGALASNGGPTQTFALLTGSSAIDAGNNTICAATPVNNLDQRGYSRNAPCDIGSYENGGVASPAKDITAFSFTSPAATGVITGINIAVTVPFGTNVAALVATFTTTGASMAVGATTQFSGATVNNFTSPVTYTVTAANATTKDYIVTVTVAANPAKDITAFSFTSPAATSVITGTNIALTVPFGTNVTALVATFATTGDSVAVGATTQVSGTTANNFTSPVTYMVTAADASTKDYIVTVIVDCMPITVTSIANSGVGTLRQAIADVCAGGTIIFNASLSGETIYLASTLTLSKNVTIDGSALVSKITISGDTDNNGTGNVRVFNVNTDVTATLNSLFIMKGTGGIENNGTLTVANSALSGNSGAYGGGIDNNGTLTVVNSALSGNSASYGGGINNLYGTLNVTNSALSGNSATSGGGIINLYGTLNVTNSTLSGNSATYSGGGIDNYVGTLNVTNSTLSDNSAGTGGGGGIYNSSGTLTVTNSTFSGNSATSQGGGIYNEGSSTLNYANTIIANSLSAGGDCANAGTIETNINNLVEDASCSASLSGDPKLDALASNGGSTQTFALLAGSLAIDAGNNTICAAAPVDNLDQRGVIRPYGAACDIGSYELAPTAKNITAFSFTSPATAGVITGTNIAVTVPFGTNVTALVATFTTTGSSMAVGATTQVSGTTTNNFTSPVTYTVTAADATTKDYIVTVTVAPATVYTLFLPLILR